MYRTAINRIRQTLLLLPLWLASASAMAQVSLDEINFVSLPGSQFEIGLGFSETAPQPEVFVIDSPPRLTLDFTGVTSALTERRFPLNFGSADSVMVLEAQGRTRLVVNLTQPATYTTRTQGNMLYVTVGGQNAVQVSSAAAAAPAPVAGNTTFTSPVIAGNDILGVDFRRAEDGAGQIVIDLARNGLNANIVQNGQGLLLEFPAATIDQSQQVRLDVGDFATPVNFVSLYSENGSVMVRAEIGSEYEYLAYQTNNQYVLNVTPVMAEATVGGVARVADYSGERITLNFQDIDVRAVLQILADFNDFSLVVGDNVTGSVTLRLVDVPWDQALDLVLRPRGLGQRLVGKVLYVAPADEIAQAELQELQANQQQTALAPLVTEYIEVNYAVATDMLDLLQGEGEMGGILTERGRATVDQRTNTIIVQDVQNAIDDIRALLARLDVPVRQVLIEARIVNASTSFGRALGIRWGGAQTFPGAGDRFVISGDMNSVVQTGNNITQFNQAVNSAVLGGTSLQQALATNTLQAPNFEDALVVDLGIAGANSSIALGYAGDSGLLQLELSALEASGNGEVIAQPKVTTQDQQPARIESGVQIPYQAQAGGTAGGSTTEFITAALSLQVTPQITPDGRIIMLLDIHQDSVVPGSGAIPAIATNSVSTRVLVNDGDTVVLGGVFREETTTTVSKTPLLGDLPYVGNIFKRTENSQSKTELLIFITPSIINELL